MSALYHGIKALGEKDKEAAEGAAQAEAAAAPELEGEARRGAFSRERELFLWRDMQTRHHGIQCLQASRKAEAYHLCALKKGPPKAVDREFLYKISTRTPRDPNISIF